MCTVFSGSKRKKSLVEMGFIGKEGKRSWDQIVNF